MPKERVVETDTPDIEFPSRLRIRQRLGQTAIEEDLAARILRFGGQVMAADEFVDSLESVLLEYADDKKHGIKPLALSNMPPIISALVEMEPQKTEALELWEAKVKAQKEADEEQIRQLKQHYGRSKNKLPRKVKKAQRRGIISMRPPRP